MHRHRKQSAGKRAVGLMAALGWLSGALAHADTKVSSEVFGKLPDGRPVEIYTLRNGDIEARVMSYGATLVSLRTPDQLGQLQDIVLGFDHPSDYARDIRGTTAAFFGATIGRYANRIARGQFVLDGPTYSIPPNNGPNSLHGGRHGFAAALWQGKVIPGGVEFTYHSPDGEEGFPGNLAVVARYRLNDGALRLEYTARSDRDTVINLTNHAYFNLRGQGSGDILEHELTIRAARFTPVDATLIPTGQLADVSGTPFDFREPKVIGARIGAENPQLKVGNGYDHNFVLDGADGTLREAAVLFDPASGRRLRVLTTEPGVQFYSGNFLDSKTAGKGAKPYTSRSALCLETQHFPDSPNHANFPSTTLKAGADFHSVTVWEFGRESAR